MLRTRDVGFYQVFVLLGLFGCAVCLVLHFSEAQFFDRLKISICKNPYFCSKDELDSNVNSPFDGSRSAECALEIFELVKSRHLLLYVTIIPIFNFA